MRCFLRLAVLAVLASGCVGGGAATTRPAPRVVTVPDVVHPGGEPRTFGISADRAGVVLHSAHLRLALRGPFRFGSFFGQPIVMHQSPAPGTRVPAGTPVRLTIEQDRGVVLCAPGPRTVPYVVGKTFAQAEQALGEVAFGGTFPPLRSSGVIRWEDAYRVSAQSISARIPIAPCTSVTLRLRLA
jgi:hypothetical protein